MVAEARELLHLLGVPTVQAPAEGEAPAVHMTHAGTVWAAASKDYDTLTFGAPRLVRFLTISGKEFLPSQGTFGPIPTEIVDLERQRIVEFLCAERQFGRDRVIAALDRAFRGPSLF